YLSMYFLIHGIETQRAGVRIVSFFIVAGCLFVIGLTVSRGALVGVAIAIVVALRGLLNRRFLPVLLFTVAGCLFILSGPFDVAITLFEERGAEETGRLLVWPLAIARFLDSPIIGVGAANSGTYVSIDR